MLFLLGCTILLYIIACITPTKFHVAAEAHLLLLFHCQLLEFSHGLSLSLDYFPTYMVPLLCAQRDQHLSKQGISSAANEHGQARMEQFPHSVEIPSDGVDVWEIYTNQLKFENKVGSGSFGDL